MTYLPKHQNTGLFTASGILLLFLVGLWAGAAMASQEGAGGLGESPRRTQNLLQESLHWIRDHSHNGDHQAPMEAAGGPAAPAPGPVVPLSSAAARERWAGQQFYLNGEDHGAEESDRVRVGFDAAGLPLLGNRFRLDYNWSLSQKPGDHSTDMGFAWDLPGPWARNQLQFRGRYHGYQDQVIAGDSIKNIAGEQQTLEMDYAHNLYQGTFSRIDASLVATDVSNQWFENGNRTGEARRSYSIVRLDGHWGSYIPVLASRGDMMVSVEGCVGLTPGAGQDACGEQLSAFQRYNLSGDLTREWFDWQWGLHGRFQFSPDELPSWRYLEVAGAGLMHGYGGQALQGREGGWLRLDSETPSRQLWIPSSVYTNLRFSLLRGWADGSAAFPDTSSRASAAEVSWRVEGDRLSANLRAGTLLDSRGAGFERPDLPDITMDFSWTL